MTDLIDTTEMYLRTILDLEEEGIVPLRARISERLGQSGPTVSQTVARMQRDGLVLVSDDRHLELTDLGRERAVSVMRKHRLAERLLADVIGLDWELVHDEACRWEHVMSEHVERRLVTMLENPTESPYGNPIPGMAALGGAPSPAFLDGVVSLAVSLSDGPKRARVRRLGEPLQFDVELLGHLRRAGVLPGARGTFHRIDSSPDKRTDPHGGAVRIAIVDHQAIDLDAESASHIFIDELGPAA